MLYPTAPVAPWPPPRPTLKRSERIALALLVVATVVLTLARLGAGSRELAATDDQCVKWPTYKTSRCIEMIPLDEVHYVPDARDVLRFGTESDTRVPTDDDGAFVVHPPVGKWFIAGGIAVLGDRPEGWRLGSALMGIAGVLMLFALARRLFGSARWALLAAGLLAVDGLWLTMSRVAMLDIIAATFTLAGVWACIEVLARVEEVRARVWPTIAAGAAFGLALATKWSAGSFVAVGVALVLLAELRAWRRRIAPPPPTSVEAFGADALDEWIIATVRRPTMQRAGSLRRILAATLTLTALPVGIYVATFTPWFLDGHRYLPPACEERTPLAAAWLCYQDEQLSFHRTLAKYEPKTAEPEESTPAEPVASTSLVVASSTGSGEELDGTTMQPAHPYFGHAISWSWIGRPVVHNYFATGDGPARRITEVMGVPNPLVWWIGFGLALPWLFSRLRRDRVARLVLAFFAAGWAPFLVADLIARPVFLFYATPLVPFVILSATALARRLTEGEEDRPSIPFVRGLVVGALIAAFAASAWMYPVHAGLPLREGDIGWNGRIWFSTDCTTEGIKVLCWI